MEIIPAIDILDGKVVRLFQGKYDKSKKYDTEPLEQAKFYEDSGVKTIHVVDLDGARYGKLSNLSVIENIVKNTSLSVEVGGGIRDKDKAQVYFDIGVERVILGTIAVKDINKTKEMLELFPGNIVLGLDTINGKVAVEGWEEASEFTIEKFIDIYKENKVRALIFTDISKDGTLEGVSYGWLSKLLKISPFSVIASGGVGSVDDVVKLLEMKNDKLEGVIIGKAIYENKIDLKEAVKLTEN